MKAIQNPKRQRGATMLGMLTIGAILALGVYSVMRLTPVYMEYYAIIRSMQDVAKNEKGGTNPAQLRKALSRHWEIEDIKSLEINDIEITKTATGYDMHAQYEGRAPFVANVFWLVEFDKTVTVGGDGGGP